MIALHLLIIAWSAVVLYRFRNSPLTSRRNVIVIVTNAVVIGLNVAGILYRLLALPQ